MNRNTDYLRLKKLALDPAKSVIVESCAGSGKTWLLISRIIRILLSDVAPSEIVAVTFTKKAAQEMEERLHEWLRFLALGSDNDVKQFLLERGIEEKQVECQLPKAKYLFQTVLSSRPGITICTFHSWFLNILRHGPLRNFANVNNRLVEDHTLLFNEVWQKFSSSLDKKKASSEKQAINWLVKNYGLHNTRDLIKNFVSKRIEWWAYLRGKTDPIDAVLKSLGVDESLDFTKDYRGDLMKDSIFVDAIKQYRTLILATNLKSAKKKSDLLKTILDQKDILKYFDNIFAIFFTKKPPHDLRVIDSISQRKNLGDEKMDMLLKHHLFLAKTLQTVKIKSDQQRAYKFVETGLICGNYFLKLFQQVKEDKNIMDYVDIEWWANQLINESNQAEYIQFKLDVRYNHILIDELQDTNPIQWRIIKAWLESSSSGGNQLQFFGVGDHKQSIYRFRGAEPRIFDICKNYFTKHFAADVLSNNITRRNAFNIVQVINKVFGKTPLNFQKHLTSRYKIKGKVEVVPLFISRNTTEENKFMWRNPLISKKNDDFALDRALEADGLAKKIKHILKNWKLEENYGTRRVRYRDILILVKNRVHLEEYEESLRRHSIPFIGAWQGGLLGALEIIDIVSLLKFLSNRASDLDLAIVLKSPIFSATDNDLLRLSGYSESVGSWWDCLVLEVEGEKTSPVFRRASQLLNRWYKLVDTIPAHDLIDRIFCEGNLFQRYQETISPQMWGLVKANLEKFLEFSLSVDSGRYPSLQNFLHRIEELKLVERENPQEAPNLGEQSGLDAIRILTIHGAKGLEAPIVWLLDSNLKYENNKVTYGPLVRWHPENIGPSSFVLFSKKDEVISSQERILKEESDLNSLEWERLLYVALTRARNYLIVTGCGNSVEGSWYQRISEANASLSLDDSHHFLSNQLEEITEDQNNSPDNQMKIRSPQVRRVGEIRRLGESSQTMFGTQLHQVLEYLIPPALGGSYFEIQNKFKNISEEEFKELWDSAQGIMQSANMRRYVDPRYYKKAWNELSCSDGRGGVKRIDRVVEFSKEVYVIDFKSGNEIYGSDMQVKSDYQSQLLTYVTAMSKIFTNKNIIGLIVSLEGKIVFRMDNLHHKEI